MEARHRRNRSAKLIDLSKKSGSLGTVTSSTRRNVAKDSSSYGMQPDSNSKVRQWLNVNHVDNDKLLRSNLRSNHPDTLSCSQSFFEVKHDEQIEISNSGMFSENFVIQNKSVQNNSDTICMTDFMKNDDDKYLFENEDITKLSIECISTYPVEISNSNGDVLFIGNENNFDTKSIISVLINANDDFENKESIEDLLNYCDPPFSPTIAVSPTTYLLNSVEDTNYDIVANELNALNNISPSAAIYTNHDSNYYPTQKEESSHGEQNRPVRKKLFSFAGSENEESSKKSSLNLSIPLAYNRIVSYTDSESIESETEKSPIKFKKLTRKRQKLTKIWQSNLLKEKVNSGLEHNTKSGNIIPAKEIRYNKMCKDKCSFKCRENFTDLQIIDTHKSYYKLTQKDKLGFLLNFTDRVECTQSKKHVFMFRYYFPNRESQKIRVCKNFFLSCLAISQKPVYNVHNNKNPVSLTPPDEQRGKQSCSKIPNERKAFAYEHINSYPTVQSHYCRADTNKKYLTSDLNISKMYDQYVSVCLAQNKISVEKHMFRDIFNTKFNLGFFSPKKDLCEICVEFDTLSKTGLTDSNKIKRYENHITSKDMMRIERDNDKIIDPKTAVVCFDLENVLTLPKTNVGCAFYKRKLNCYNLTAHLNLNGQIYCAIWNEGLVGRSGNDLASAIVSCLEQIIEDHRSIEKIITWSDSCVPQNRNSLISCAVINLMIRHPNITSVHMKYSIPGHSCIQEVDNAHSQIEKAMKNLEVWSPIGLTRVLLKVNRKKPFKTLQMRQDHFKNYYEMAKPFKFSLIPFASVAQLFFSKTNRSIIQYKTCHGINEFILVDISSQTKSSHVSVETNLKTTIPAPHLIGRKLTKEKIKDIETLFKFMPEQDVQFYHAIFETFKKNNI